MGETLKDTVLKDFFFFLESAEKESGFGKKLHIQASSCENCKTGKDELLRWKLRGMLHMTIL